MVAVQYLAKVRASLCSTWPSCWYRLRSGIASPGAVPASAARPTQGESPSSPSVPVIEPPAQLMPVTGRYTTSGKRDPSRSRLKADIGTRAPRSITSDAGIRAPRTFASDAGTRAPRTRKFSRAGRTHQTFSPCEASLAVQEQWERQYDCTWSSFCITLVVMAVVVMWIALQVVSAPRVS